MTYDFVFPLKSYETLNNNSVNGSVARVSLFSKKNTATYLQFVKDKTSYWKYVWMNETKTELFGLNKKHYVWRKINIVFQGKNFYSMCKT